MTYILPADNAVIDYSILSQMINAINSIDSQLQSIVANQQASNTVAGGSVTTALSKVVGGTASVATGATKVDIAVSGLKNIISVVGILEVPGATSPIACSLSGASTGTGMTRQTFVFSKLPKAAILHWIAYGTN